MNKFTPLTSSEFVTVFGRMKTALLCTSFHLLYALFQEGDSRKDGHCYTVLFVR